MANYKKSFNFRHGVQVDNDNFIVNANGLVGIGTSIPTEFLDVKGNAAVSGLVTTSDLYSDGGLYVAGVTTCGFTTITDNFYVAGVVTATTFYGNGRLLDGVVSISTDGFIKTGVGLHTGDNIGIGSTATTTDKIFAYSEGLTAISIAGTATGSISGASLNLQNRSKVTDDYTEVSGVNGVGNSISAIRFHTESTEFNSGYLTLLTRPQIAGIAGQRLERIRITSDGKVGVGTTNPGGTLDIDGDVIFRGNSGVSSITWDKSSNDLTWVDGAKAKFGTGEDLSIYHDGTDSIINNTSGEIKIRSGKVRFQSDDSGEDFVILTEDMGAELYYDGNKRFSTLSIGATVTGDFKVSNDVLTVGVTTSIGGFVGNLTGTATTSTVALALTESPHINVSNVVGVAATFDAFDVTNKSFTVLGTRKVGIGTTIPTSDFQIRTVSNALLEVITDSTNSRISIGNSVGLGNSSTVLRFNNRNFEISNNDYGNVIINLHAGDGDVEPGIETGGFRINHTTNGDIFKLDYEGKVGINRSGNVLSHNLEVGGDTHIEGSAVFTGILTAGQGVNKVVLGDGSSIPTPTTQNFYTTSGISTFSRFDILNNLQVVGTAASILAESVYIGDHNAVVGVGTTNQVDWDESEFSCKIFTDVLGNGKIVSRSGFGLLDVANSPDGSFYEDPRTIPPLTEIEPNVGTIPAFTYGNFQIDAPSGASILCGTSCIIAPSIGVPRVGFGSTNGGLASKTIKNTRVGINTYFPRGVLDLGLDCPKPGMTQSLYGNDLAYLVLPSVTQFAVNDIATSWNTGSIGIATRVIPDGIPQGSLLFNSTTSRLEVGIGTTTFCGIVTLTNNHVLSNDPSSPNNGKLLSAFIPPSMTSADRLRLTNADITRGATIYNTDDNCIQFWNGTEWRSLTG